MHPTISSYLIPSMIAVGEHIRVGSAASRLAESKNYCMIYDIKRIIGKTVDMISDKEKERWPFEVRSVENTTVITIPNNIKSCNIRNYKICDCRFDKKIQNRYNKGRNDD